MNTDPLTGAALPPNAYQRVLYIAPKVHIYQIPPLTSTKGYQASTWTADNNKRQIFTARLRVVETCIPTTTTSAAGGDEETETVTTALLLEDAGSGQLFAAAPYTSPVIVEQAIDSSRFFAITVVGEGRKAVLGMGFEERSEAFDFSIALQDARRTLGFETNPNAPPSSRAGGKSSSSKKVPAEEVKQDFSLKEGETISINFGGLKGRRDRKEDRSPAEQKSEQDALFSIQPPPASGGSPFLPPPPSAKSVKEERRRSRQAFEMKPQDMGFDDGEFGEFQ
jgi:hypothetical protein